LVLLQQHITQHHHHTIDIVGAEQLATSQCFTVLAVIQLIQEPIHLSAIQLITIQDSGFNNLPVEGGQPLTDIGRVCVNTVVAVESQSLPVGIIQVTHTPH